MEEKINTVRDKIDFIQEKIHRKKRASKRGKLHPTRQKKFDLNIIELEKDLEVLTYSKNEFQTRLYIENNKLINLKEQILDIRKDGQTNPFNFCNTFKDDEIELGKFINIAENNITVTKTSQYSKL